MDSQHAKAIVGVASGVIVRGYSCVQTQAKNV